MNFLKIFYPKNSLKRKIMDIKDEMKKVVSGYCNENFWIEYYGAYEIHPKNLVYWICVNSDTMKLSLRNNAELVNKLKRILVKFDYPKEGISYVGIDFESQETVNRESNGDWYLHFK